MREKISITGMVIHAHEYSLICGPSLLQTPCITWMDSSLGVKQNGMETHASSEPGNLLLYMHTHTHTHTERPAVSAFGYRLDSDLMDTGGEGSEVSESESESEDDE